MLDKTLVPHEREVSSTEIADNTECQMEIKITHLPEIQSNLSAKRITSPPLEKGLKRTSWDNLGAPQYIPPLQDQSI